MALVYLLLGTNLGDRSANIDMALRLLEAELGPREALSEIRETEAEDFEGPAFLNCVARFRTRRAPLMLLRICKEIERKMGRRETMEFRPDGSRIYHSRVIDIDILLYGDKIISTPELTVPHKQIETRHFVGPLLSQVRL